MLVRQLSLVGHNLPMPVIVVEQDLVGCLGVTPSPLPRDQYLAFARDRAVKNLGLAHLVLVATELAAGLAALAAGLAVLLRL